MILSKRFCSVILFSVLFLGACSAEPKQKEEIAIVTETPKPLTKELVQFADGYKLTLVLSQKGCTACNVELVKLINKFIATNTFGTVIETTGRNYDISSLFLEELKDKIFKDYKRQLTKRLKTNSSYLVYHRDGIESEDIVVEEITVNNMEKFEGILKSYIKKAESKG